MTESLDDVLRGLSAPSSRGRRATMGTEGSAPPSAAVWGTVFTRWEEIVGPSLARHTRPLRLESAVLVVAVDQPPWATQVRALAPGILDRLRERTGETLEHLEVVVRR